MSSSQSSAVGGGGGDGGHFESGADADIEARPLIPKGGDEVYGGIDAPADGLYFSTGPSLFGQLAWYF